MGKIRGLKLNPLNIKQRGNANNAPLILLHGLFGKPENWTEVIDFFSKNYNVIAPELPLLDLPIRKCNLGHLLTLLEEMITFYDLSEVNVVGNSLGGHLALLFALKNGDNIKTLTLTGSSGLYEENLGASIPQRTSYEYVEKLAKSTVYDESVMSKDYIEEIFSTIQDSMKALKIVSMAKSAQRNNLAEELHKIKCKVLLIWGENDTVTPSSTANSFRKLISDSSLYFIPKCGHAPMMERPKEFIGVLNDFLK